MENVWNLQVSFIYGIALGVEYVEEEEAFLLDIFFLRFVLFK
jgi:hypothetical protein